MNNFINDKVVAKIDSEVDDDYSDDSLFNITFWGADLSFREIISMYSEGELIKPELQRNYVWDKTEASRFVESVLMGLPIPSIFFAQAEDKKLIVDGYQRIMTIFDYVRGIFSGDGKMFKLSNSKRINVRWRGKAFQELTLSEQRKIRSTTIHAIIFEQKHPKNGDTSLYQVFERINTSGRTLTPQEIRNCIYQGSFNKMLFELNENKCWRILFGTPKPDTRMRDLEFILRFFAIKDDRIQSLKNTQISLKKELNDFMENHKKDPSEKIDDFKKEFVDTMNIALEILGENAFHNYINNKFVNRFHPTIFDAISVGIYNINKKGRELHKISGERHISLLQNENFKTATSTHTTEIENILLRINLAVQYLEQ